MSNIYNIKDIRQLYNLTQEEFAIALGLTRELINKMEKGRLPISKSTTILLQQFVQRRQSEQFSHELEFIGSSQPLNKSEKQSYTPYHLQRREQKNITTDHVVPLVAQKAHAGYIKSYDQVDYIDSLEKYSLPPGVNPTGAVWSYFEIDGDSMEPTLASGDIILASMLPVEDWEEIRNFYTYVILTTENLLVKRIYRKSSTEWILLSDNEEAAPQVILDVSHVKQVWVFRRHIRSKAPVPKQFQIIA
jgi:phage repressor protein C with HTH and peptisase S24 domain